MLEILSLVAIGLALYTLNASRNSAQKLGEEVMRLKREVEALKAGDLTAPVETVAVEATEAISEEAAEEPVPADFASPWAASQAAGMDEAEKGRAIFGGTPAGPAETVAASEGLDEAVAAASATPAAAAKPKESFESRIGARWAVWVGGIALALGGIFMVKYSIEAGLLSPAVRLSLAAVFGLVLMAVGEFVRRRTLPVIANAFQNAMIPGVLTAAGAITLFAVTYVSYEFYGYFGPLTAFVLLAAVAFATIGLSLLHGQALAGLGLLASLVTPALIATEEPSAWGLFGFLSVAWLATFAAARIRRWLVVPALASAGMALWAVLYLSEASTVEVVPMLLALLVMALGLGLIWPGNITADDLPPATGAAAADPLDRLLAPPAVAVSLTGALALTFPALILANAVPALARADYGFAAIVMALALLGALRGWAIYPALFSAITAVVGAGAMVIRPGGLLFDDFSSLAPPILDNASVLPPPASLPVPMIAVVPVNLLLLLAVAYAAVGLAAVRLRMTGSSAFSALWSLIAPAVPFVVVALSFLHFGNLSFDLKHGLLAVALGLAFFAAAEVFSRGRAEEGLFIPQWTLVAGGFAFLVLALHAMTDGLATTLGIAILGAAAVFATRLRRWPVLPWLMAGAAAVVAGRIGWEPTIVGAANLSKTPVFNQLLAGYGIPAALLALSAFELRRWPGEKIRNLLQALASLFVLLTAAILVRHGMNGGVLDSSVPTLGEQSIYTLLVIGAAGILMSLDLKSPSPVFRYGSMVVGGLSVLSILSAHFVGLNPYFTGELLGKWPFLDLLFVGYLLPGIAYGGLALYARGRRPMPYVIMLALTGVALAFSWVTLSVRRYWHGEGIADWKGFLQPETYTYSVVWLLLGVLLLVVGSKFDSKSIRLASAGLVLIAVVKVFLIDMANLEGILRALSFIGLGAVLIGIGLFYQKILSGKSGTGEKAELNAEA
ncbi:MULTISPECIES: DUF2339 domain-containing protein [unclassified Shinella]|uniref:DUF2339 domain-containing protein n=1 Tax=unclassified Shinella TaxID=2643062 RepID=UPI00234FAE89|nr:MULTISPECIES: DUF2339 domain-containing protein [unclassified Shinella]MCO5150518.1 DUF2339 domain-containing protein [Shinella sp.]MDC7261465.1 DUF2339 domain-containing protein [Shinella sp. HY16]MDC7268360.1 DUF2339 domain-containing protein [Shinella sp. YZ44]